MPVHFIGIRHHSPACAKLVKRQIERLKPAAVLIEAPSDFNARLDELLLNHRLPIAIYSYYFDGEKTAQSWFPLLSYSPEFIALKTAKKVGSRVHFMDLPHWAYRVQTSWQRPPQHRYEVVLEQLLAKTGMDNQDALWDSWFEHAPTKALPKRLHDYFDLLRDQANFASHDDPDTALREHYMARQIGAMVGQCQTDDAILVVCGGWHKPALERLFGQFVGNPTTPDPIQFLQNFANQHDSHFDIYCKLDNGFGGSYLIPYSYRQVDNLSGYQAGMPSPQYYEWLFCEPKTAHEHAITAITQALRQQKQPLSTADLIGWRLASQTLANLRGRTLPSRHDVLDGFLMAGIKEALPKRAIWTGHEATLSKYEHPAIEAALHALTGDKVGELAANTPLPPLIAEVTTLLTRLDLLPSDQKRRLTLHWREPADRERLQILWQLSVLGCDSVQLHNKHATKTNQFDASETWILQKTTNWFSTLIEASRFGATLQSACQNALQEQLLSIDPEQTDEFAKLVAWVFVMAIRTGLHDYQNELGNRLAILLPSLTNIAPLTSIGTTLKQLKQQGFWGGDIDKLLDKPLSTTLHQLMWVLDGTACQQATSNKQTNIASVLLFGFALHTDLMDSARVLAFLNRLFKNPTAHPNLRGSALGVYASYGEKDNACPTFVAPSANTIINLIHSLSPKDDLGEFLYGLFAGARQLLTDKNQHNTALIQCLFDSIRAMNTVDFLVALPTLRLAFAWFSSQERQTIAKHLAKLMNLSASQTYELTYNLRHHPTDVNELMDIKQKQAQVQAWLLYLQGSHL